MESTAPPLMPPQARGRGRCRGAKATASTAFVLRTAQAHVRGAEGEEAGSQAWQARQGQECGRDHDNCRGPPGYHSLKKLWGLRAVAQALGLSVDTTRRLAEKQGVAIHRLVARYFDLRSEFSAWLRQTAWGSSPDCDSPFLALHWIAQFLVA